MARVIRQLDDEALERPFNKKQLLRLLSYMKPHRKRIAASLVLMIVVRATYPKNVFGLVLMILHIVAVAVILISALLVMAACYDIMRQCSNL